MSKPLACLAFSALILGALPIASTKVEAKSIFHKTESAKSIIKKYGEDLVKKAKKEKWTDITGRDEEIDHLINLLRRHQNLCITGEAGVGKTALIEGLAAKIAKGDVPDDVKNWVIIKVDFPSLVLGKGSVDDKIRTLFDYAAKNPNVVIFIDEVHQFAKYADLCKTCLDRRLVKFVGATTSQEYDRYISYIDPALARRLYPLYLEKLDN